MARLVVAEEAHVDRIYSESYGLWGAGLSRDDYLGLWRDVAGTPWAQKFARFLVWLDDEGRILSSLKLYHPLLRVGETTSRCCVLGAVFTPRARRREGHATALVQAVLERGARSGTPVAMLFSDIGTAYYEALGFRALPADEQWGDLPPPQAGRTGIRLHSMQDDDREAVRLALDRSSAARPFCFVRDAEHWEFVWVRTRSFFERLRDPRIVHRCRVAERDGVVVGYLVTIEGRGEWNVREVGATDGEPETMRAILERGLEEAVQSGLGRFYGWLPPELLPLLGHWNVKSRPRRAALPMIRPLAGDVDLQPLALPGAGFLPYQDQF